MSLEWAYDWRYSGLEAGQPVAGVEVTEQMHRPYVVAVAAAAAPVEVVKAAPAVVLQVLDLEQEV